MLQRLLGTQNDFALTLLRAALGTVYLAHGSQKVLGAFGGHGLAATMAGLEKMGIPAGFALLAIAAEFLGGLGLLLGLFSRIAAAAVAVEMAVAVALVHRHFGFFMNWTGTKRGEGFEFHILAIAIGIYVAVRGAGAFSMDRLISRFLETQAVGHATARNVKPAT